MGTQESNRPRHRRKRMTPNEVAAKLQHFNDWRRGHHDDAAQPDPREIGEAIDAAIEQDTSVRKAWARFSNELHRSPDAPYPGMSEAFEQHFSQSFTDREWRSESGTWAAAWKAAKRHEAQAQPAPSVPEGWKLVPIEPTPGMMRGAHRLVAAARRVLASADSQGLIRLDESGDVASELRSALEAAPEAKP